MTLDALVPKDPASPDHFAVSQIAANRLCPLSPEQRCKLRGKWFHAAKTFARRAASLRALHAADLSQVPYGSAEIEAQIEEVERLEEALCHYERLARLCADSLLLARSRLFDQAMGVLRALTHVRDAPFQDDARRQRVMASVSLLRRDLDRRNQRISESKRAQKGRALPEREGPCAGRAGPAQIDVIVHDPAQSDQIFDGEAQETRCSALLAVSSFMEIAGEGPGRSQGTPSGKGPAHGTEDAGKLLRAGTQDHPAAGPHRDVDDECGRERGAAGPLLRAGARDGRSHHGGPAARWGGPHHQDPGG